MPSSPIRKLAPLANEESVHKIADGIREHVNKNGLDWNRIMGVGVALPGRVNPVTGYSNNYSFDPSRPIGQMLEENLNVHVVLENDSRAMTYGEYLGGGLKEKNMLYVNVSWGLGMGMILNGRLYYGTSGYSGEFGHFPLLDNGQMCRCGKIGCLETGASGSALVRMIDGGKGGHQPGQGPRRPHQHLQSGAGGDWR